MSDQGVAVRKGAGARRRMRFACLVACLVGAVACFDSPAPPSSPTPPASPAPEPSPAPSPSPTTGVPISGSERIGWDQRADSASIAGGYTYWIYVDGVRVPLVGVECSSVAGTAGYPCSAPLPPLTSGSHVLELSASLGTDGSGEGPRSAPFSVVVTAQGVTVVGSARTAVEDQVAQTADGLTLSASILAEAVRPVALRFAPDRRLFIAEQDGRVRVLEDGVVRPEPALVLDDVVAGPSAGLLDMALAPDFDESRLVYIIYTTSGRDGLEKVVARYREVGNQLAERAILVSGIPAALEPDSAALAFGPDGALFVLTGQPADARTPRPDLDEGQLLRLNPDGTTPRDNPASSPIVRRSLRRPAALVWTGEPEALLVTRGDDPDAGTGDEMASAWRDAEDLVVAPSPTSATRCPDAAVPEFRTDLFVAVPDRLALLRLPLGQAEVPGPVAVAPLFEGQLGPIAAVSCSPEGDLYVATRQRATEPSQPDWILRIAVR